MSGFHSCNPLISIPTPQFFALVAVGSNVLEIVVPLFQYAGDLGDANAFYTYAQLLRTGKAHTHTHVRAYSSCYKDTHSPSPLRARLCTKCF